jgi:hypothetical protein
VCVIYLLSKDSKYLILVPLDILEQTQNQQKMRKDCTFKQWLGGNGREGRDFSLK